jgi:hypothetical protein
MLRRGFLTDAVGKNASNPDLQFWDTAALSVHPGCHSLHSSMEPTQRAIGAQGDTRRSGCLFERSRIDSTEEVDFRRGWVRPDWCGRHHRICPVGSMSLDSWEPLVDAEASEKSRRVAHNGRRCLIQDAADYWNPQDGRSSQVTDPGGPTPGQDRHNVDT